LRGRRTRRPDRDRAARRRPLRARARLARQPQRRRRRGPRVPRPARLLRPVPPRGGGRPARRRLPLRPVRGAHAPCPGKERLVPRRTDIRSVLVIGSGPIVIGQAAEFDYSGTQACRVLREEGLRVILVNSNPATIMTDPEFADATYVEPITLEVLTAIIAKEKPDAVLPTLGGQTALNAVVELDAAGVLAEHGVEIIGASIAAISKGEDRQQFKDVVERCGGESARSVIVHTIDEADLRRIVGQGLQYSPTTEVLLEESILGWKEFELELMRDRADNV